MSGTAPSTIGNKAPILLISALLLFGIALRLATVPSSFVWLDEANSIRGASMSLPGIITYLCTQENSAPLFSFLLHLWIRMFGDRDVVCALMPAIFSILTIPCIFFLARELFGGRAALWALFLSSVNVRSIEEATNIRFYSLLELLTTVSYLLFFKMVKHKKHFWLYVLTCVIGVYEHYYFAFVILSQLVICLLFHRKRIVPFVGALCIVAASFSPWIPVSLKQFNSGANSWLPVVTDSKDLLGYLYRALFQDSGISLKQQDPILKTTTVIFILSFLSIWAVRIGIYRESIPKDEESISVYSISTACLVCVGLPIFISMAKPIFAAGRYDIIGVPLIVLFFSWAFSKLKNRWIILFLILFYSVKTLGYQRRSRLHPAPAGFSSPPFNDKVNIKKLSMLINPDDVIIYTALNKLAAEYYLNQYGVKIKKSYVFPLQFEEHPGWIDVDRLLENTKSLADEARLISDSVQGIATSRIYVFNGAEDKAVLNYLIHEMDKRFTVEKILKWNGSFYDEIRVYALKKASDG